MTPDLAELADFSGRPVIVGSGLAGLLTALHLAPRPCVVVTKSLPGAETSSALAQGGIAAAVGPDDSAALHAADTIAAGDGLCVEAVVRAILASAPAAIGALADFGVNFDRDASGAVLLGLEAAHGRRRIVHAGGDATGRVLVAALVAAVRQTPSIRVLTGMRVRNLLMAEGAIIGLALSGANGDGGIAAIRTRQIVLATGGIGGLFAASTNPLGAFGEGLALAARAGAVLADMEFVQFHPTALDIPTRPMPLVSEAVRGEGAVLIDETGARFCAAIPGTELAPRDIVARAVARHRLAGHKTFLDARRIKTASFAERFPGIDAICKSQGIDPSRRPIPICPAAHYHMGGIATDLSGRSSIAGLWACGEVASTGLHGANRLASNSLLEAAVMARAVATDIAGMIVAPTPPLPEIAPRPMPEPAAVSAPVSEVLGIEREGSALATAIVALYPLAVGAGPAADPATVALVMAVAALAREESRGAHLRRDFPHKAPKARRSLLTLAASFEAAAAFGAQPMARERVMDAIAPLPLPLIEPLVRTALAEDLGHAGDITTNAIVPPGQIASLAFVARRPGTIAGLDFAALAFRLLDPETAFAVRRPDGSPVGAGEIIATISGPAPVLLTGERTALNFLSHASGIASATAALVSAIAGTKAKVVCTRKTTPGLRMLEKYAVRIGGGGNHRFGLFDAVLIKDNHIAIAGGIGPALTRARAACGHLVKIEIEIDNLDQIDEALGLGADILLLDNMAPDMLAQAVRRVDGRAIIEASGGITAQTIGAVAATGVDFISVGWLTHSAPILDIGLDYLS